MCNARLRRNSQWVHVSNDRIVLFWSTHTECECSSEPVPMFLTTRVIVLHHFPYLGPAGKGLLYTFPTSKWLFSCARAPTRGTPWAESGILFYEPDVLHTAVSSQILFTTTTYGCIHVERITAFTFFTLIPNPNPNALWRRQRSLLSQGKLPSSTASAMRAAPNGPT